jgi:hypothetical protein
MSRVLTVKRGGGRGFALLIALLVAIALFHETLARALGGPAESYGSCSARPRPGT